MKSWLKKLNNKVKVIWSEENHGPRQVLTSPRILSLLPRHFCLTDPDLEINAFLPEGFLADLIMLAEKHKIGKVGFALNISDRIKMLSEKFEIGDNKYHIWQWEEQFWNNQIDRTSGGDPVYKASIDTTFALYDKNFFDPNDYLLALRVAGRFTARHLPWYGHDVLPADEVDNYIKTQKYSFYYNKQ
jgi:hypothetical protein